MKKLKESYEKIVNKYLQLFCEKHEFNIQDGYWVGKEIGDIIMIGDYYFNFDDIRLDIDENVEEKIIFDWYEFSVEKESDVSYRSWVKGYRPLKCWISNCFFDEYSERELDVKKLGFEPKSLEHLGLSTGVDSKYELLQSLEALSKCQKLMLPIEWEKYHTCRIERDFFLEGTVSDMNNYENENIIYV